MGANRTHQRPTVDVDLGGHLVSVAEGGLYDRFRMNTDLDEIERNPQVSSVEFFRQLPKTRVDSPIGPTLTPNFYYRISTARLIMLAPTSAIRAQIPRELDPLELIPGIGIVSVMLFRYDICDIDFYTELGVGVAVRAARHGALGVFDLVTDLKNESLHSFVLSLPVSSQIAQVRGRHGYGFPKWVGDLDVNIDQSRASAQLLNDDGSVDLRLSAPTPKQTKYQSSQRISTLSSYTTVNQAWHCTTSQINVLSAGRRMFPRGVDLQLGTGRVSEGIRSLRPTRTVQLEVMTEGQLALHMPVPTSVRHRT